MRTNRPVDNLPSDVIEPDEITEEVLNPKEARRPSGASSDPAKNDGKWAWQPVVKEMSLKEKKAFYALPKVDQAAYLARIDEANAKAEAYLRDQTGRYAFVESDESQALSKIRRDVQKNEEVMRWLERRRSAEARAEGEREDFLVRILKEVAREEDLDSLPGWALAAFEVLPFVSAAYAFFGVELRTEIDPATGEVTGIQAVDLTKAERAIHAIVGELTFSKKITMTVTKILKKIMARAVRESLSYVASRVKTALT